MACYSTAGDSLKCFQEVGGQVYHRTDTFTPLLRECQFMCLFDLVGWENNIKNAIL
jgi:hypothetical protein